jgi:hypothetical protein
VLSTKTASESSTKPHLIDWSRASVALQLQDLVLWYHFALGNDDCGLRALMLNSFDVMIALRKGRMDSRRRIGVLWCLDGRVVCVGLVLTTTVRGPSLYFSIL